MGSGTESELTSQKNRIPAPAGVKEANEKATQLHSLPYLWTKAGAAVLVASLLINTSMFVPLFIMNQAVAARRLFEADRDIIAPYLTPPELLQLQADFASIETKSQYIAVMQHISNVASLHHAKIHPFSF
jgi:hypothetical protein